MTRLWILRTLSVILAVLAFACVNGCGNDQATVNPPINPPIPPTQISTKVAFNSGRATGDVTGEPFIMNSNDGSGVTPIPYSGMAALPRGITVSPDESKMLCQMNFQVYTANLDGTAPTALTSAGSNILPRWSPNGKQIVFASTRDGVGGYKIYVMNADGSNQTRLSPLDNTAMNDIFPSFSWDGREIVFVGWDSTASAYGIWIMNIDGSNRASVIVPATIPVTPAFRPPRTFAYEILWVDNGEIASIFQGGSGQTTLTNSGGTIEELMVLGKEVWFTTTQDGNPEVYKMNGDGTGQRNMTNNQYADRIDMNVP